METRKKDLITPNMIGKGILTGKDVISGVEVEEIGTYLKKMLEKDKLNILYELGVNKTLLTHPETKKLLLKVYDSEEGNLLNIQKNIKILENGEVSINNEMYESDDELSRKHTFLRVKKDNGVEIDYTRMTVSKKIDSQRGSKIVREYDKNGIETIYSEKSYERGSKRELIEYESNQLVHNMKHYEYVDIDDDVNNKLKFYGQELSIIRIGKNTQRIIASTYANGTKSFAPAIDMKIPQLNGGNFSSDTSYLRLEESSNRLVKGFLKDGDTIKYEEGMSKIPEISELKNEEKNHDFA